MNTIYPIRTLYQVIAQNFVASITVENKIIIATAPILGKFRLTNLSKFKEIAVKNKWAVNKIEDF